MLTIEKRLHTATITRRGQKDWSLSAARREPGLENLEDEYMPMDVFVDPETIKEQFNTQSARGSRIDLH